MVAASTAFAMGSHPKADDEAVNARIQPIAKIALAAGGGAAAGSRSGEQMFQAACNGCHASGALNAPKVGDAGAWGPRLGKGLDGLLKNAVNGIRAMPPKGGVADATDAELARAIVYMANKSGGSLKEPK
jgi:cytochrome c5